MGDETEHRITQIKAIQEEEKRKHSKMMENLRHNNVMEELKFMAEHNITSFSARLPPIQTPKNFTSDNTRFKKERVLDNK